MHGGRETCDDLHGTRRAGHLAAPVSDGVGVPAPVSWQWGASFRVWLRIEILHDFV